MKYVVRVEHQIFFFSLTQNNPNRIKRFLALVLAWGWQNAETSKTHKDIVFSTFTNHFKVES